ncbi:MAG: autotransporter-associated beta strand repeat-containing protein [Pirellulales bacterium]
MATCAAFAVALPIAPLQWNLQRANAAPLYWDTNGATAGAGATPNGVWDASTTNWSTDAAGTVPTSAWINGSGVFFSAGTDAVNPFTVSVIGTHTVASMQFEEGTATLNGGILNLITSPSIQVSSGVTATINSVLTGTDPLILNKTGAGLLTLGGHNTYSGGITIMGGGVVRANWGDSLGTGTVTIQDTGTILEFANALDVANNFVISNVADLKTLRLTGPGSTVALNGSLAIQESTAGNFVIDTAGGSMTINGQITSTGAAGLNKLGTGVLRLTNNSNSFTGTTTLTGGTLRVTQGGALGSSTLSFVGGAFQGESAPLTITNAISLTGGSGTISGSTNLTFSGNISHGGGNRTLTISNTGTTTFTGSTLTLTNSGTARTMTVSVTGGTTTINNQIVNGSGTGTFTKSGAGILILGNANNSYTGVTSTSGGALQITSFTNSGSNSSIGAGTTLNIGSGGTSGTLLYVGSGNTSNRTINMNGSTGGTVINSSGTGTLQLSSLTVNNTSSNKTLTLTGTNTDANTISAAIPNSAGGGTVAINKTGAGLWILSGANTNTGTTTVNGIGGILRFIGVGKLSTGALNVRAGTLDIAGTVDHAVGKITIAGTVAGATATIAIASGRTLTMNGDGTEYINYDNNAPRRERSLPAAVR